ncbi:hypothetical protein [Propylenella binzhouense]|uniref:Secreted protein n=1 Tax=Propylenella binzhouense TaxID=2555902 RepID=A0A964T7F8_9HYPH|nr:hypothetical protein [Propylenella binzhouense]MYZ49292.1 hypothetical protein [Propylenella binzhouense]
MLRTITGLLAASALGLTATAAMAECGFHQKQVMASTAEDRPAVVETVPDQTPSVVAQAELRQAQTEKPACPAGQAGCGAATK